MNSYESPPIMALSQPLPSDETSAGPLSRLAWMVLALIAIAAIAGPLWMVTHAPPIHIPPHVVISTRIVPKTELPPVEPVKFQQVAPDDARAINAAIPYSTEPNIAARAFRISGAEDSQARAIDCLAAANFYEAGNDATGQKAVAQVIVNRMRHPAFPKTVCGVVFQGSERSTGCQFTFTCDGAMLRYGPSATSWAPAQEVARAALAGSIDKTVGLATHYHTDWVVPYWSASLEKISAVGTHLFFRWAGWWGTPPAFTRGYAGVEPNVPLMARVSPNHIGGPALGVLNSETGMIDPNAIPASSVPAAIEGDDNSFLVALPAGLNAESFASLAIRTCGDRVHCKFMAWSDASKTPPKLPLNSQQVASMSFSYLRDQNLGFAKALWNCEQYKRQSPVECMRAQPLAGAAPLPTTGSKILAPEFKGPPSVPLPGVRRKGDPEPAARPPVISTVPAPRPTAAPK